MKWLYKLFGRDRATFALIKSTDPPEKVAIDTIYLVGEKNYEWSLTFNCPCGCGSVIQLNLLKDESPRWQLTQRKRNSPSIYPSIRRTTGCRSHFCIYKGNIRWVK